MEDNKKKVTKNKTEDANKRKTENNKIETKKIAAKKGGAKKKSEEKKIKEKSFSENVKEEKMSSDITKEDNKKKAIKDARRKLNYAKTSDGEEFGRLIKIILIVTVIMVVFYGVTVVVTNKVKEAKDEQSSESQGIQYDNIMVGSMLKINGNFYVLIEDQDDSRISEYDTLKQTIAANPDAPKIFVADLSDSFNSSYLSSESNYESDMTKFRVTGTTLVKIEDHKITEIYDSYDEINDKLKELE